MEMTAVVIDLHTRERGARRVIVFSMRSAAPVFAALGDATRLALVARLCLDGPLSIVRLSDGAGVTRQAVTKHLHALADAGLVRHSRSGRERIWELEPRRLEKARRCLDRISDRWGRGDRSIESVRRGGAVKASPQFALGTALQQWP
jgi:DNA-binding transcriptional ArsR family regulator